MNQAVQSKSSEKTRLLYTMSKFILVFYSHIQ